MWSQWTLLLHAGRPMSARPPANSKMPQSWGEMCMTNANKCHKGFLRNIAWCAKQRIFTGYPHLSKQTLGWWLQPWPTKSWCLSFFFNLPFVFFTCHLHVLKTDLVPHSDVSFCDWYNSVLGGAFGLLCGSIMEPVLATWVAFLSIKDLIIRKPDWLLGRLTHLSTTLIQTQWHMVNSWAEMQW